eukprot:CAMPEP_0119317002 /NCGR_PEP_ID=MMETSP1333-20130426/41593_1 /TAXON_ID=418940 /ORGANISM="Scyphosphaera apsteinii, Strain RCC1455" /LENGTH=98 /DNA_ID=CAMNT_0007322805 /DNA_START=36 /DNA_END=332 /DNA_ORIENTATION=+
MSEACSEQFNKAADVARNSTVSMSMSDRARGYGLYKVATTNQGPDPTKKPGMMANLTGDSRQKWLAHEAAWEECGKDCKKAQELYIEFVKQCNPGALQ